MSVFIQSSVRMSRQLEREHISFKDAEVKLVLLILLVKNKKKSHL